jgi:predicted AlkP superfamily pyrophosphatase or phosphodiesterase
MNTPTKPQTRQAGYCTDSKRAEAVRRVAFKRGVPVEKLSIRDPLIDDRIYTAYSVRDSKERAEVVRVAPGNQCEESFTSAEMTAFNRWAWDAVKSHAQNRWSDGEQEVVAIDWEYIDAVYR